jgi:hypothetical protein
VPPESKSSLDFGAAAIIYTQCGVVYRCSSGGVLSTSVVRSSIAGFRMIALMI